jgi:hypothetical protein
VADYPLNRQLNERDFRFVAWHKVSFATAVELDSASVPTILHISVLTEIGRRCLDNLTELFRLSLQIAPMQPRHVWKQQNSPEKLLGQELGIHSSVAVG